MRRAIERGDLFRPDVALAAIEEELLPLAVSDLLPVVENKYYDYFCGVVGTAGAGKSVFLDQIGYKLREEKKNVVKLKLTDYRWSIPDVLYHEMRGCIYNAPRLFDRARISSKSNSEVALDVLRQLKNSGCPVTLLIDLYPSSSGIGHAEIDPYKVLSINSDAFVRELKYLATDIKLLHCIFCSSEGLQFQTQALRERRFRLYITRELSVITAKKFLKDYYQLKEVNETHLRKIQRTFPELGAYAGASDKDLFVRDRCEEVRVKIERLDGNTRKLLQNARANPAKWWLDSNLTDENVVGALVRPNLIFINEMGRAELQFDIVREVLSNEFKMHIRW